MNTLESLTNSFVATFATADNVDLKRARIAYAACSTVTDGGLGISTRDFADAVSESAGRGFKQSTVARLVSAYRLAFTAGTTPTAEIVGLALSVLNNGRKVGETFAAIALETVALPADVRGAALASALRAVLNAQRSDALAARKAKTDSNADRVAEMLAPSPVGDDREASDRGVAPVPASLDTLLAAVTELAGRIASGEFAANADVWAAVDMLNDAIAAVPALA